MTPLKPISGARKAVYGVAFFVLFVAAWDVATFSGFVSPIFLADPLTMLREGYALFAKYGFAKDVALTIWRVVGGFVLAAAVAVPLGIAMGAYKPIEAFFEPFVSFARYLPASAFIPLLILWAGIGELQKLLVIFIGSFFQIVLMVAVTVGSAAQRQPADTSNCRSPAIAASRWPISNRSPSANRMHSPASAATRSCCATAGRAFAATHSWKCLAVSSNHGRYTERTACWTAAVSSAVFTQASARITPSSARYPPSA